MECNKGESLVYHVTTTDRLASIQKEGIQPGKKRRWNNAFGAKLGENKLIYLFESEVDAEKWAFKMDWDFKKPVSILSACVSKKDLKEDSYQGIDRLSHGDGDWYISTKPILPKDIKSVKLATEDFFREITQKVNHERGLK